MVSASGSETSALRSTPTSAIIYEAYTSIKKKNKKKIKKVDTSTRLNSLFFEIEQEMSRTDIWQQVVSIVDKKFSYIAITCRSR